LFEGFIAKNGALFPRYGKEAVGQVAGLVEVEGVDSTPISSLKIEPESRK